MLSMKILVVFVLLVSLEGSNAFRIAKRQVPSASQLPPHIYGFASGQEDDGYQAGSGSNPAGYISQEESGTDDASDGSVNEGSADNQGLGVSTTTLSSLNGVGNPQPPTAVLPPGAPTANPQFSFAQQVENAFGGAPQVPQTPQLQPVPPQVQSLYKVGPAQGLNAGQQG